MFSVMLSILVIGADIPNRVHAQVFTGGMSSFTLFNMVVGYLKHLNAKGKLFDQPDAVPAVPKEILPGPPPPSQLVPPPIMTCHSDFRPQWEDSLSAALMCVDDSLPPALPAYIRAACFEARVLPEEAVADPEDPKRWPKWPLDTDVEARVVSHSSLGGAPRFEALNGNNAAQERKHDYGECLQPFVCVGADAGRLVEDVHEQAQVWRRRLAEESDLGRLLLGALQVRC
jgi:hypothetical protein